MSALLVELRKKAFSPSSNEATPLSLQLIDRSEVVQDSQA